MKKSVLCVLACAWMLLASTPLLAGDREDADKAAKAIMTSLQNKQFGALWDSQMTKFFQSKLKKDSFLANMTMGRAQLGSLRATQMVDMAYSQVDPASGVQGEIYAFTYLNTYDVGKFYERIVVMKEADNKFRLAGLWGTPAPK